MAQRTVTAAGVARLPRRLLGRAAVRARAWRRQERIDDALAAGTDPWSSPDTLVRAVQLCALTERRRLAAGLEDLVARAQAGRPAAPYRRLRGRKPAAPYPALRRREVLAQREALLALAVRVRAFAPVPAAVVARLMLLQCDGSSPVFAAGLPAEGLAVVVDECLSALGEER
jgi:hypothetical protein